MSHLLVFVISCLAHFGCTPGEVTGTPSFPSGPPVEVNVAVDYSQRLTASLSWGFLHSISATAPADSFVTPLKPTFWRSSSVSRYDRIVALGSRFELVLSDGWAYPSKTLGWPYENPTAWQAYVLKVAQQNVGRSILWDVWNEPDKPYFWAGTDEQLFETYRQAYQILRSTLGAGALIGGPSPSTFDREYITNFLEFCLVNGCQVNFLSWHENGRSQPQMRSDVAAARALFLENPRYASLRILELQVNEFGAAIDQFKPAAFLANLATFESSGITVAARTCWKESTGVLNCSNDSLDGLLTEGERRPRAVWWAAQAFTSLGPARAATTSSATGVTVLAGTTAVSGAIPLLVGYFDLHPPAEDARISLTLRHLGQVPALAGATSVHVRVQRIPDAGEFGVPTLPTLLNIDVPVAGDSVNLVLGRVLLNEVFKVALSRTP